MFCAAVQKLSGHIMLRGKLKKLKQCKKMATKLVHE